ncbi:zinc finger protein PLAGL1-like [Uloborus diversus]|uniref:zinc finger protein PLAGL1-like n=1 Tax=Uloborus diversus TaxID=327109 RepID=UPI0024098F08|nr:zinc finger protein PLAGL1-like [Uloborus diversus]
MSRIGMRDSDGEGQSRDGNAIQHQSSFGFENFEVANQQRRRPRRGQLQKNEDEEEKPEAKAFMCMQPGCPRTFSSRFKLVRHILIHSGERRFQCTSCGRRFHRKDHLKNHLQVHNPNKILHSCELCQKTYCSLLSYRKHIALHAAEAGDLVCKLCGKMLADREGIMHHLKVHTGSRTLRGPSERKFPCDRCDRSFFTKKDVKRHLVVHTGKRDFVCQFCPQRFGRKDHLVRHTKKSHMNNSNNATAIDPIRKYEPPPSVQPDTNHNHKSGPMIVPSPLPDMSGLVIPTPVSSMMDGPVLDAIKPESGYVPPPQPSLVQSNYGLNSLPTENGQSLSRFTEPSLLPVSQYLPMTPSYPTVTPIMPHHYINMSTSNNILSDLLPPMSMAPSFTSSLSLDVGNSSLPHFNQAFQ